MKRPWILILMLLPGCLMADITPRQDFTSDCSVPPVSKDLTFVQASSQDLGWTFKQGTAAKDLTGANLVRFSFTPTSKAWVAVVTGSVESATAGKVLVSFTTANLNTNTTKTGKMDWLLEVSDGTKNLAYAIGKMTLMENPASGVTNSFLAGVTSIDWSAISSYSHTSDKGPYRIGSGMTQTTNTDGSLTLVAQAGGATGETSKAYVDGQDIGTSNGVVAWVGLQGYGTVSASSNAAMAGVAASYVPFTGGTLADTSTSESRYFAGYGSIGTDGPVLMFENWDLELYPGYLDEYGNYGVVKIYPFGPTQTNNPMVTIGSQSTYPSPEFNGLCMRSKEVFVCDKDIYEGGTSLATKYALASAAVTNNGCTINGSPVTNGAAITVAGGGGGGGSTSNSILLYAVGDHWIPVMPNEAAPTNVLYVMSIYAATTNTWKVLVPGESL